MKFIRNIILFASCLALTGCAGVGVPTILDAIIDGAELTKEQFAKFCEKNPLHKACKADNREKIEAELERGPIPYEARIAE